MKRFALCFAVLFALSMMAAAQDTSTQTSAQAPKGGHATVKGPQKSPGAVEGDQATRALTGCVEKSGDNYMLQNAKYKNGVAVHGNDDLSAHVGHTVRLSGTWATPGKDFNETKVNMVSDTCNAKVAAGGKHKKSAAGTATPPQ